MILRGDRNQCPACGEYFNSTYAFDKHRVGPFGAMIVKSGARVSTPADRRCLGAREMLESGMSRNSAGFWITKAYEDAASRQN